MCGILGWQGVVGESQFESALSLMKHRGPDDSGIVKLAENFFMGHQRLSIIDLSAKGRQPMQSPSGRYTISFNGEIYNFREIRSELRDNGYKFQSDTDTEVLLYAWEAWQEGCLTKLVGMFAFAIFDAQTSKTVLVRDRFGIKPLYFYRDQNNFGFSSEVKALLALISGRPILNTASVASYFSFRYSGTQHSFFKYIEQVPPGHLLRWRTGEAPTLDRYYHLARTLESRPKRTVDLEFLDDIRSVFEKSVQCRMIADVPVGAYLSGGVDSSGIVAKMHELGASAINTYTIGFIEEGFNEFQWAKQVANHCKTNHHEIMQNEEDYISDLDLVISLKDAPLGVPNEVSLYSLSLELKKKITVVLSGEGADEVFGGYGRIFRSADDFAALQARSKGEAGLSPILVNHLMQKYQDNSFQSGLSHFLYLYRYTPIQRQRDVLSEKIYNEENIKITENPFIRCFDEFSGRSYVDQIMYAFVDQHLPGLLQRVDTTTMGASVEARVPFVDHRLVELAFSIDGMQKMPFKNTAAREEAQHMTGDKISEGLDTPKYILKKILSSILPPEIINRRKVGFPVPLLHWRTGKFQNTAEGLLKSSAILDHKLVNIDNFKNLVVSNRDERSSKEAMFLWMLINLEFFLRRYDPLVATN